MATQEHGEGLVFHPMDQFSIRPLFGDGAIHMYTPTNATLWMAFSVLCIFTLFVLGTRGRATVPSRIQSVAELGYGFIHKMVADVAGKDGLKYFPYIFTVFCFIVFSNFLGLLPKSFTSTSHVAVTGLLAIVVFVTVTVIGFVKNGAGFLALFWIDSAPLPLRPLLAVIEVISYFVRPVSHSIRLAGNMMAGHAVIKVFRHSSGRRGPVGSDGLRDLHVRFHRSSERRGGRASPGGALRSQPFDATGFAGRSELRHRLDCGGRPGKYLNLRCLVFRPSPACAVDGAGVRS